MWQKKGCWILLGIHLLILCIALISSGGIRGLKRDWSQAFLEMGERLGEEKPKVALTFDDGPHPVYTEEILDGLRKKGVKATFFVIGKSVEEQKEIIERMGEEGHLIGNHTYDHVNLGQLGKKEVCVQIEWNTHRPYGPFFSASRTLCSVGSGVSTEQGQPFCTQRTPLRGLDR